MNQIMKIAGELARRLDAVGCDGAIVAMTIARTIQITTANDRDVDLVWAALDHGQLEIDRPRTSGDGRGIWRSAVAELLGVSVFVHGPIHDLVTKGTTRTSTRCSATRSRRSASRRR
jgi:hypothetical protein